MQLVKSVLGILLLFFYTACYAASKIPAIVEQGGHTCYAGKLSNSAVKNITQVRIALKQEPKYASYISFYTPNSKHYVSDVFCKPNHLGRCGIENDRGSFVILSLTKKKMEIEFNGLPQISVSDGTLESHPAGAEIFPNVDASVKLDKPIRMTLTLRPSADCSY